MRAGLSTDSVVAGMTDHRGDLGPELRNNLGGFGEARFEGIKARPQSGIVRCRMSPALLRLGLDHTIKVFGLPSEGYGQGLECAGAAAALDGVPLDFPYDGHRHVRAFRKFTLAPAELADTVADSQGNRSPVLRIAF